MIPLHEIVIKITKPTSPNYSYTAIISEPIAGTNTTSKLLGIHREFSDNFRVTFF